jgi:hypothetical protein
MSYGRDIDYDLFREIADEVNGSVTTTYSGRGMHGATCPAITGNIYLIELGARLVATLGADEGLDVARDACVDSMGLGHVVYFPHCSLYGAPRETVCVLTAENIGTEDDCTTHYHEVSA